jgi:ABC-type transport system substrate-binding protein
VRTRLLALPLVLVAGCTGLHSSSFRHAAAGAVRGGTLRVAIAQPGSVDPGNDYEPAGDLVIRTMCDTLVTTDPRDGTVRPGLAESWVVADSGAKLVLRLRKGLRFSDGTPLTSNDVAYSLSRVASADFASNEAERLVLIDGFDLVHGDKVTDSDRDRRLLRGVTASDKRTVEIRLTRSYADFVRLLAARLTAPVSQHAAEADPRGFSRSPVCAGPYRLASPFTPGQRTLRLVRSRAYVPADAGLTGGGGSYADEIRFSVVGSEAEGSRLVAAGRADVAPALPTQTGPRVESGPGPMVEYVGLPTQKSPFDNVVVRRALALALSREELVRRVFPLTRVPATGFLPATTGAAHACDALPADGDVNRALALLRKAGLDLRGVKVALAYNAEFRTRDIVTEVARQWRDALGLVVTPEAVPPDAYLRRDAPTGQVSIPFRFSWAAPDVDGYLTPLFTADAIGRDNLSRFSDASLDDALDRRAWRAVDADDRALAYQRIADLVCQQMPMIPLTTSLQRYVVAPRVASAAGRFVDASTGQPLLREMFLSD